jgi:hypothetical protein
MCAVPVGCRTVDGALERTICAGMMRLPGWTFAGQLRSTLLLTAWVSVLGLALTLGPARASQGQPGRDALRPAHQRWAAARRRSGISGLKILHRHPEGPASWAKGHLWGRADKTPPVGRGSAARPAVRTFMGHRVVGAVPP